MQFKVEMEDGSLELVADCHWTDDLFRLHRWGDVWLMSTLTDDVKLFINGGDRNGETMTMAALRKLEASITTTVKSGGELRRTRSFKGKKGINKDAKPFSNQN